MSGTSTWAVASICCSVVGIGYGPTALLGVVFGHLAKRELAKNPGMSGHRLAGAGLIIGYAALILSALVFLVSDGFSMSILDVVIMFWQA